MKKTMINTALALAFGVVAVSAQAATFNTGDKLSITAGTVDTNTGFVNGGSWFAMDNDGNSKIGVAEKVKITQGTTGIVIGSTQAPGAIDNWSFFSAPGKHFTTTAITGGTAGVNMSGWTVNWNGLNIPMTTNAWQPLNLAAAGMQTGTYSNGVAKLLWDGIYGDAYTLDYTATVPAGDPSGMGGVQYALHLTGAVTAPAAVPVPAAAWLLGSGLLGLVGVARRRKQEA